MRNSRACGTGWSKQLVKAHLPLRRCEPHEQKLGRLQSHEGSDTLMRRTILVKLNQHQTLKNQGFFRKNTHKGVLFC